MVRSGHLNMLLHQDEQYFWMDVNTFRIEYSSYRDTMKFVFMYIIGFAQIPTSYSNTLPR